MRAELSCAQAGSSPKCFSLQQEHGLILLAFSWRSWASGNGRLHSKRGFALWIRGLRLEMQNSHLFCWWVYKGLKLQALNEANIDPHFSPCGPGESQRASPAATILLKAFFFFFLESSFQSCWILSTTMWSAPPQWGKMANHKLRSHQEFLFQTPEGSSMALDFSSQLSVSWNKMHFIRRLNHSIMEPLWLEKTFQVIKMIWNIVGKFDIIHNSSGLPKDSHKGPFWSPCLLIFECKHQRKCNIWGFCFTVCMPDTLCLSKNGPQCFL